MRVRAIRRLLPRLDNGGGGFDIIHIQTPFVAHRTGVELSRRLGVPRVETYHTFFEEYLSHYLPFLPPRLLRYMARRFTASQCNNVDAVMVPSTAMRDVQRCEQCRNYTEQDLCGICRDARRDPAVLCVVESPADVLAIESAGGTSAP